MKRAWSWRDVRHDFERDGVLRDVYVQNCTVDDWQAFVDWIRVQPSARYTQNDVEAAMPSDVRRVFEMRERAAVRLEFDVGGILMNAHFFMESEIELSFRPDDLQSEERADDLAEFLQRLSALTTKPVLLTPENLPDNPIFRCEPPSYVVQYLPSNR